MREIRLKRKHNRIMSVMLSVMMLFNMIVISDAPSYAAHPDYYFSSITVEKNGTEISTLTDNLQHGDTVRLNFGWSIDNTYLTADGDVLTHRLPEAINWSVVGQNNLTGPQGTFAEYGSWEIVDAGGGFYDLKITFGPRVDTESNVMGTVIIEADINTQYKVIDLPYKWSTAINGNAATELNFDIDPDTGDALSKTGSRDGSTEFIEWTIDFNTTLDRLTTPVLTDDYSSLLKYDTLSPFTIVYLDVDSTGGLTEGADASADLAVVPTFTDADNGTDTGLGGTAAFSFNDTNKAYRITYRTEIDPAKIDFAETDFVYGNRVKLDNNSYLPTVEVPVSRGYLMDKVGALTQNYNAETIDWTITINNSNYSLSDVFIEDTLPVGLNYRDIVIKDASDNTLILGAVDDYIINIPGGGDTFTFQIEFNNPVTEEYVITYTSDIDNSVRATQSDELSFTNEAKMIHSLGDAVPKDNNPTIAVKLGRVFYKKGQGAISYDDAKYLDWEIYINLGEASLGSDAFDRTVVDVFSSNEYLYVVDVNDIVVDKLVLNHSNTFDPDEGNASAIATALNNLISSESVFNDYTVIYKNDDTIGAENDVDINKFELMFNTEVDAAYKISYRTKVIDKDLNSFTNTGSIGGYGEPVVVTPTIANIYSKNRVGNGINYLTNKISWKLTVNPIKELIDNLTITDTIPSDQYLSETDFDALSVYKAGVKLDKKTVDLSDAELSTEDNAGTESYTIKRDTQTLSISGGDVTVVPSFEIMFDGTVNQAEYTVEYNTTINPNTYGNGLSYTNEAVFNWTGDADDDVNRSASPNLVNTADANGQKYGEFDGTNDRMINWEVDINYFSKTMSDETLSDTLPDGLILVPGSVKVYDYSVLSNGSISVVKPNESTNSFTVTEALDGHSFEILLNGEHYSPYHIEYSTMLEGISKEKYNNTASLINGESFSYEVTYDDYNKFISKNSSINNTDSVDYTVTVNESKSTIENLVIIDTLSQGLEIDMSSFEITEAGMDFDDYFELTIEAKTLITEPTVVVMTAKNTAVINDTFTIIYSADIDEDEVIGKKVSNSIELTGDRVNVGITSDTVEEDFTSISGFGTGTGEVGSFTLTKVDKDDNTIKLEGAEYELKRGTKVLGTLTTDSDGEITVGNLLYLGHTLTETKAPDGYILDTTPYDFTIDSATKTFTLENEMLRTLNIKKVDSSNASKVLSGARFEVYDSGDVLVSTLTTDNLGYANIVLDLGDYSIKEVKAPSGYYLNSVEQLITIDISSDSFEVIFENRRKPSGSTFVPTPPEEPEPEPEPEPEVVLEPIPEPEEEKVVKKTTEEVPTGGEIEVPEGTEPKVSTPPTNGTVEIDDTGKWTYTPNPDFEGEDAFTITVEQPDGSEEIIYFEIEVEETPLGFVKLPQTGKSIPWANYIGGLFVMLIGVVLLKKRR